MFAKIFSQIFSSSIAEDYQVRHIFMDLLVLADRDGIVDMTPQAIARTINVPLDLLLSTLSTLSLPDPDSRSPGEDGRRIVLLDEHRTWGWRIVNFESYHQLRDEDSRREYQRNYQRERRAAKRVASLDVNGASSPVNTCQHLSTPSTHIDTDIDTDKKQILSDPKTDRTAYSDAFLAFWNEYPKTGRTRSGRPEAWRAWKKNGCEALDEEIGTSLAAWKLSKKWTDNQGEFVEGVHRWIYRRPWETDPPPVAGIVKDEEWDRTVATVMERRRLKRERQTGT